VNIAPEEVTMFMDEIFVHQLTTNDFNYNQKIFVLSLLAMTLELRFCASRKGWTGGGGWVSALR